MERIERTIGIEKRRSATGRKRASLLLAVFFALSVHAEVYKWVDEKGQIQYGDQPPPRVNANKLAVAATSDAIGTNTSWQDKDLEFKKRRVEVVEKERARVRLRPICNQARGEVKILESNRYRIWEYNDNGDPAWLSRNERQASIERKREFISRNCE